MKNVLAITLATLSLNVFAQSYLILDDGITISTDKAGFAYELGHYSFPEKIVAKGGQFFIEEGGVLVAVDDRGLIYRSYEVFPRKIQGTGFNYLISSEGAFYGFNQKGFVTAQEPEEKLKNVSHFGGNYFVAGEEIFTVDLDGKYKKSEMLSTKTSDIITVGGNYFMSNRGILYTISSDGTIAAKSEERVGIIMKKGGNFFIDSMGTIFTIAEDGTLKIPAIPAELKVPAAEKMGTNYLLDKKGRFFLIDKDGSIYGRRLTGHEFITNSKVLSY